MRSVRLVLLVAGLLAARAAEAASRRALLVGVERYAESTESGRRGGWPLIEGARNDVLAMRDLLVARYGFRRGDVTVLLDGEATREAILGAFERVLVSPVENGDVGVFYFAGHGSWVRNSLGGEADGRDETIVAFDGKDIRDKELARRMAASAARGSVLTALFDSCHSGSIARGVSVARGVRAAQPRLDVDARDPDRPPNPVQSGVLVMSAAQDYQSATEVLDDDGVLHGAFTAALLKVLRAAPIDADAESVFLRTRALLHASGAAQDPLLDGPQARWRAPLFGAQARGRGGGRLAVAAGGANGDRVELLAGLAVGLAPGTVLVRESAEPRVRVRVEEVLDLSRSFGRPATPADAGVPIAPGDLFGVERWAAPGRSPTRVYLGPPIAGAEVRATARRLAPLRRAGTFVWVQDPSRLAPTHVLFRAASGWRLRWPDGHDEDVGERPAARSIARRLEGAGGVAGREAPCDLRPCLYVRMPVPSELAKPLEASLSSGRAATAVGDEANALYLLAGRLGAAGAPEYSWVLAIAPSPGAEAQASPLPRRSAWCTRALSDPTGVAASLEDAIVRIGRIRAWLTLEAPPQGEEPFPYHLGLAHADAALVPRGGSLRRGEVLEPILVADPAALARGSAVRNVYVLVVDSDGRVRVLYPPDLVSVDNRFPAVQPGQALPARIPLDGGRFRVVEPLGVDTYVLLATERPIPALGQVEQDPVTRGPGGDPDALLDLLAGSQSRGLAPSAGPGGWTIDRVVERSAR